MENKEMWQQVCLWSFSVKIFLCCLQALTKQILSDVRSPTPVLHYLFVNVLPHYNVCTCTLSKKCLTCISREYKPIWHLSRKGDFAIIGNRNFFVHERLSNRLPRNFSYTFRKGGFPKKNVVRIKEWIFANVCWNV